MNSLITRSEMGTMVDRLFEDFFRDWQGFTRPARTVALNSSKKFGYPRLNLHQEEDKYVIEAAVPGLKKEEVNVEYADGVLTVSGATQNNSEINDDDYVVRELHKSSFSRSITVDEDHCDVENIEAGVKDGLLTVKIPKKVLDKPPNKRIIEVS